MRLSNRFDIVWEPHLWTWRPYFHCTGCCYFWLWWGPLTIGVNR